MISWEFEVPTQEEVNAQSEKSWTDYLWDPTVFNDNTTETPNFSDLKVCTGKKLNPDWPYKALYIDTLPYNQWQKYKDKIEDLIAKYSTLPKEMPPSEATDPKKEDGEEYDPVCDKYWPLDFRMLGVPILIPSPLRVKVAKFDIYSMSYYIKFEMNAYSRFINQQVDKIKNFTLTRPRSYYEEAYKNHVFPIVDDEVEVSFTKGTVTQFYIVKIWKNLLNEALQFGEQVFESVGISIVDGYAYLDTGVKIECEYTGIPIYKENNILIPGIGMDYGTTVAGVYHPRNNMAMRLSQLYPYQNDLEDGQYYWQQDSIFWPHELARLAKIFEPDYEPIKINFEVYEKIKLPCGFPKKCGEMTQEELDINGICRITTIL